MNEAPAVRVALTLEQCWHRVPGGTAVAAIGMARSLDRLPHVTVAGVSARHLRPAPSEWAPPVAVAQMPLPRLLLYESWHRLRRPPIERATGRVDVVHATSIVVPPRSAPLVVTVHDLAWLHDPSNFTARGRRLFQRGLELVRAEADLVHCPSNATRADVAATGIEPERLAMIPLGIDVVPASDDDVARVRARYELNRPYVLWTGTVEPRKNLGSLAAAWRLLEVDIDLVLAGPAGWNEDLDSAIGGRDPRVHVLGFVSRRDLGPLYAGAELFCWPSLLEGFGFPVLEAMAQGTPVVTSRGTSTEELAAGAGVLVDPRDPADIADGMERVLGDSAHRKELADAGRARALAYSWDSTARALAKAYARVVG